MLPRRHLFFCLIALAALAGCKTKTTRTPDAAVAGTGQDHGSRSARQGTRHGEQNAAPADAPDAESKASAQAAPADANPATKPGTPTTSPRPPDVPPRDTRPPSATSAKAVAKVKILPKENPSPLDSRPSPPVTPPKPAHLTVAAVTPPAAEPAHAGRVSLNVLPISTTAPRPVARLTLGESLLPTSAPKTTPIPIGLPNLVTAAPTTAPVQRLTAGIAVSSPSELQPARPQSQSIDLLARLASPQAAAGSQDQAQTLRLPLATTANPIQTARFDQSLLVPLPDTAPVLWQTKGVPVISIPVLSNWLSSPPPPPPPDSPAAREDREILHRKIYQILLGP